PPSISLFLFLCFPCLSSLSLPHPSLSLFIPLSLYLSIHPSLFLSVSIHPSFSLSINPSLSLSVYPSLSLSLSFSLSINPSLSLVLVVLSLQKRRPPHLFTRCRYPLASPCR